MAMPKIILSDCNLSEEEYALCKGILNSRTGELRASKPPVPRMIQTDERDQYGMRSYSYKNEADADAGRTAYIWRMVAFMVSPISQHHCMPCTADFDVPGHYDERRAETKRLDLIVDKVVNSISPREWHGVARWAGLIG